MTDKSHRIFIVEDEAIVAADLSDRLGQLGFEVAGTADSGERALRSIPSASVDLVLMDIVIKGRINGIETARQLRSLCDLPVVYLTSHADNKTVHSAVGTDPYGYVLKPFNDRELQVAIRIALLRHGTETKLRRLEKWMATTLASIGDGVIATDPQGRITLLNAAAQRLTGWADDEALGRQFDEVFRIIDAHSARPVADVLERGRQESFELGVEEPVLLQRRQGGTLPIDDSVAPIRDDDGQTSGVVLVFRDATQRVQAEAMQREKLAAEMANEQKSRFLSRISHELRTPLNAILGFTQLLEDDAASPLDSAQRQRLSQVRVAGYHLLQLINDVLDLSRIERGSRLLQLHPISVAKVLAEACDLLESEAAQRGVLLVRPDIPPNLTVQADARAFQQVLLNLLSNGIKYNRPSGKLSVDLTVSERELEIGIRDEGQGLDPDQLAQLFQPFNRLGAEYSRVGGTGLGLVIAKSLAEAMDGLLSATSQPGFGTRFALTLPRLDGAAPWLDERSPVEHRQLVDNLPHPQATVLYIEDDPVNALLVVEALRGMPQWKVVLAEDGSQGLAMARRLRPELILTDINLPGMSGHDVVSALRADPATRDLRCIALSADAMPEQVAAGTASGFDGYLTKPIDLHMLVDKLREWLQPSAD